MKGSVKYIFGCLLWLLTGNIFPAVAVNDEGNVYRNGDTLSEYHLRVPDTALIKSYREDASFDYVKEAGNQGWWERFVQWLGDFFSWGDLSFDDRGVIVIVLKALAILLAVFFIYKLIRAGYTLPFGHKEKRFAGDVPDVPECVDEISYPLLLERALAEKNYPQAVRVHYLYVLYLLNARGIICQSRDKTNVAYIYEIKDKEMKVVFCELSRFFDYVYYGEFEVDEWMFGQMDARFRNFQKELGG